MSQSRVRIFLWIALAFLGLSLYSKWVEQYPSTLAPATPAAVQASARTDVPNIQMSAPSPSQPTPTVVREQLPAVHIETDLMQVEIDPHGGDIIFAAMKDFPATLNSTEPFILLDRQGARDYIAQSGLVSQHGPDSQTKGRAVLQPTQSHYEMRDANTLQVPFMWADESGDIQVKKVYTFERGKYDVSVQYFIHNNSDKDWIGHFYAQLAQDPETIKGHSNGMLAMQTYHGAAVFTEDKPYKKLPFDKFNDKPFKQKINGGWAALVEHYFLSAWIYPDNHVFQYFTKKDSQGRAFVGAMAESTLVPAGTSNEVGATLYLGPEKAKKLEALAPGLKLTVDYGFLWPVSQFLFWIMQMIYGLIGNWGWAIILTTLLIKVAFYRLSASSYRSMAKMRRLQPKMTSLKERYGDDKQQFSQALMKLYKDEKVNPLGGCLPILLQIPVFIALYYVLLESVEFRQAPFILWVTDLSAKDPYFVLPLLMGASMFVQQKLNPAPPDPIQAKVMMAMPVVFTVLFLQFPAGLVLYWFVNNLLSISQQWWITHQIEKAR